MYTSRTIGVMLLSCALALAGSAQAHDPSGLTLASVNAAVARADGGEPIYTKNPDRVVPVASLTKLMTAVVVMRSGQPLDEWLTVVAREHEPANNAYSRIRIGSRLPRGELLRLALMSSENLAAHVLASHHPGGRDAFIDAMNATASELGMRRTRFVDPSGLSPDNRSTAADLLRLVRAAHGYETLREYTTTGYRRARFRGPRYALAYGNTNPLVHSSRWRIHLSKTGYLDEAGRCLAMVAEVDGTALAMVLLDSLGTRSPLGDAGRIRRWLTSGQGGPVAEAARTYARRRNAAYERAATSD